MTALLLALLLMAVATACGGDDSTDEAEPEASGDTGGSDDGEASSFPLTVSNCDFDVTVDQAAGKVVAGTQNILEIMLALDQADKVVGRVQLEAELPAEWQDASDSIDELQTPNGYVAYEEVLSLRPDLVAYNFNPFGDESIGYPTREEFTAQSDIASYLLQQGCAEQPEALDIENTYTDILNIGQIVGADEEAQATVADMQARVEAALATIPEDAEPPRVAAIFWQEDAPVVNGGASWVGAMIKAAGGENVFDDISGNFGDVVSWEQVIDADPEVIVTVGPDPLAEELYGPGPNMVEEMKGLDLIQGVSAVANDRFVEGSYMDLWGQGPRNAEGIEALVEAFYPDS